MPTIAAESTVEIEHDLVRRIEELAEEFADVPLSVVVHLVNEQAVKSQRAQLQAGQLLDVDPDAIAEAVRRELLQQRGARSHRAR